MKARRIAGKAVKPGVEFSPSKIVADALGMPPDGTPSKVDSTCACCGYGIKPGDIRAPMAFKRGFVDSPSFAAPGSLEICGWCAVLLGAAGLRATARGVFSAAGVTPFGTWLSIKAALLEPPEPPFVALYSTKNNQHMAWRAPISFSRDLFYVRVGEESLLIRRPILLKALEASSRLRETLDQYWIDLAADKGRRPTPASERAKLRAKSARRVIPHVFLHLSSDVKDASHGVINPMLYKIPQVREGELGEDLRLLENLTLGELWAMTFITYVGGPSAAPDAS